MINPFFIKIGVILLGKIIDKIFDEEDKKPESGRGREKREAVVGGIIGILKDGDVVFDDIYGYVDAQVKLLNDRGILWAVGSIALRTIINDIFAVELNNPSLPGSERKRIVIDNITRHMSVHLDLDFYDIRGYIDAQVELLHKYHIFKKEG